MAEPRAMMLLASAGGNRVPVIAQHVHGRVIRIGREALRCLLRRRGITFQRTKT